MRMNFRDAILDALVDDGESIKQISEYLQYLGIAHSTEMIENMISKLLNEQLVKVSYPKDKTVGDFLIANEKERLEFWFELTEYGLEEWDKIEE